MRRTAEELLDTPDPAWVLIERVIAEEGAFIEVLPGRGERGRREIENLQVTGRSVLGALAYHTGGLLLDCGWLRILGCGHERCEWSITSAGRAVGLGAIGDALSLSGVVVAVDALGGVFAVNHAFLPDSAKGAVHYFSPDGLEWKCLDLGHAAWVFAMLEKATRERFYADLRWEGWEEELKATGPNCGISVAPPLFTADSRPIERASRRAIPIAELVRFNLDIGRQLGA